MRPGLLKLAVELACSVLLSESLDLLWRRKTLEALRTENARLRLEIEVLRSAHAANEDGGWRATQ